MSRSTRQSKILDIIKSKDVETQEDLVGELIASGISVTQATISRDIKELGLVKTMTETGKYKYSTMKTTDNKIPGKLISLFKEAVLSVVTVRNLIVVRTLPGSAGAVANVIDQVNSPLMLGTLAGADILIVICENDENASELEGRLAELIKS